MATLSEPSAKFLPLWRRLRGHGYLWHRTSLRSIEGILNAGAILPNTGQFPNSFGQSKISYSRHLGGISLFDFDSEDEKYIFEHEFKWGTVLTKYLPEINVAIQIWPNRLDRTKLLLPSEISRDDSRLASLPENIRKMRMCIPAVEALYVGSIQVSAFAGFLMWGTDGGDYLFHETTKAPGALTTIGGQWISDYQQRMAERHSRGKYSVAELLEMALLKRKH